MRKIILTLVSVFMVFPAICQNVEVGTMKKIETGSPAYYPILLDDGRMLTTSSDYTGLVLTDLQNGQSRVLSSASGAGYNVRVSADKKNVIYQECSYTTGKRMTGYSSYALDNGVSRRLQAPQRSRSVNLGGVYAVSEDLKISVYRNGQKTVLAPNGEHRRYIWPSVSPDGKKLLYTVSGVGTYVCNIDGTSPVSLGILRAPKWVSDSWVVGMENTTTEETSVSVVVMSKIDGSCRQTLTPSSVVAMYPSATEHCVAFSTDKGEVYCMEISINE